MAITREDLLKILNFIRKESVKDTQFPQVKSLDDTDKIPVVAGVKNSIINLSDFMDVVASCIDLNKITTKVGELDAMSLQDALSEMLRYAKAEKYNGTSLVAENVEYMVAGYPNISKVSQALNYLFSWINNFTDNTFVIATEDKIKNYINTL
jgi:hypothetical protein